MNPIFLENRGAVLASLGISKKGDGFSDPLKDLVGNPDKVMKLSFPTKNECSRKANAARATAVQLGISVSTRTKGLDLYVWIKPGPAGDHRTARKVLLDELLELRKDDEEGKRRVFSKADDKAATWLAARYMDADPENFPPEGWQLSENRKAWAK